MEKNNLNVSSTAKQATLSALGERLRAARINAGLTQQRVAERLEATPQSVFGTGSQEGVSPPKSRWIH